MQNPLANFHTLSPEQRKALILLLKKRGIDVSQLPIASVGRDAPLPLSYGQQRLWFLAQLEPDSSAYHIADAVYLNGQIDVDALQRSIDKLVARHESLRTTFRSDDGKPVQIVHDGMAVEVQWLDLSTQSGDIDALAKSRVENLEREPFDLVNAPLLRVAVLELAVDRHVLVWVLHHIVADEWSLNILLNEFAELYQGFCQGREAGLTDLAVGYADFAVWQRYWLEAGEMERQLTYWRERLGTETPQLDLPLDRPRPAQTSDAGAKFEIGLPDEAGKALREICRRQGATAFMGLLTVFYMLLYRYSGQRRLRVGVPVANRNRRETESLVGFFVNTQVLQTELDGSLNFYQILERVKEAALGAQAHADLPFDQLVEALSPQRSLERNPLFQVMYNHQYQQADTAKALGALQIETFPRDARTTQFELILDTFESVTGRISAIWTYATDLFDEATIARMAGHFCRLVEAVTKQPGTALQALPLLDPTELDRLLPKPSFSCEFVSLPSLIGRQAAIRPEAVALIEGGTTMTYGELHRQSHRLAHYLIDHGLRPGAVVALSLPRSASMLVASLAVWQCGAAFLALDPAYPAERLQYMLDDAGAGWLLGGGAVDGLGNARDTGHSPADVVHQVNLSQLDLSNYPEMPPEVVLHPETTAYLIYTSGSTGRPKGVAVGHGALAQHCRAMAQLYGLQAGETCLHFASFSFDAAIEQWTVPLLRGATLVIGDPGHWSVEQTLQAIREQAIDRIDVPPAYLTELARQLDPSVPVPRLTSCTVGGEALPRESLALIQNRLQPKRLFNAYGPTEAVITPLAWQAETTCDSRYAPIGQCLGERTAYVLDADLNPLPIGVAGELYIGGLGLAQGYWHQPGLTAERFLPDPFGRGGRLYRTGDRVRQRSDGVIEYLGRIDQQLKLRGFRIEPGEIEAVLLEQPGVNEAAVRVGESGRLLGYVAVDDAGLRLAPNPAYAADGGGRLRDALSRRLPDYLVPAQIIVLPHLPKLPSGKLDRKALPEPERVVRARVEPRNDTERRLAQIWQEVLGLEAVGIEENFFELGGDSIISLQVVSRARQAGWHLSPKDIFRHQTVAALAQAVEALPQAAEALDKDDDAAEGDVPLTPIQAEFFATDIPRRGHWNQSVLLASGQALHVPALAEALRRLTQHHDAFRLRFEEHNGWRQHYASEAQDHDLLWQRDAAGAGQITEIAEQAQRSLDLQHGPVLRAAYIRVADGSYRLLLVIHHLIVDGVSWRIVLEDLQTLYRQLRIWLQITSRPKTCQVFKTWQVCHPYQKVNIGQILSTGKTPSLPAKTASYRAWAEALQGRAVQIGDQLDYWRAQLAAADLPADFAGDHGTAADADTLTVELDETATRQLLSECPAAYRTRIDELLLAALARVLCRWTGQGAVSIDLEGHGRESFAGAPDVSRSVGWFTSLYPVLLTPADDWAGTIKAVKEQLRAVPERGLGFGLLKYLADAEIRAQLDSLSRPALCFNYLGRFDASFDADGLFRPAGELRGDERDTASPLDYALEVNGQIYGGRLAMNWTYNRRRYRAETVAALAEDFNRELAALVEHCRQGQQGVTPSDFPLAGLTQAQLDSLPLPAAEVQDIYPLTPMQQGMLFHSLYENDAASYVSRFDVRLEGLDAGRFAEAWRTAMHRHAVLRTAFYAPADWPQAMQIVHKRLALPLVELDWRGRGDADAALPGLLRELQAQGLPTDRAPLFKLVLVRLQDAIYHFIWLSHHLLLDGWSSARLLGEVLSGYRGDSLPPPAAEFRDYIAWLAERDPAAAERCWRERLPALEAPTRLADALPRGSQGQGYALHVLHIDGNDFAALRQFAQGGKLTVNTLVQAAWCLLLQRYCGGGAVAFGVTVSGRPGDLPGAEEMVGLFINTLPVIQAARAADRVSDWLQALQQDNLELREVETTPLADAQRWWGRPGEALFDTLLVFENYPLSDALRRRPEDGLRIHGESHRETTNFSLTLAVQSGDRALQVAFDYDRRYFDEENVADLAAHFRVLLTGLVSNSQARIGELPVLTGRETALFQRWNQWTKTYDGHTPVHELIRRQAEAQPEAIALIADGIRLRYAELEVQANRLAHRLIGLGLRREGRVALLLPRGVETIVAMLAVLKAGGAYLPLDPEQPEQRLAELIAEAGVCVAITRRGGGADVRRRIARDLAEQAPGRVEDANAGLPSRSAPPTWLMLDETDLAAQPTTPPEVAIHPEQLAYLILTSGSTGTPKGVAVPHGALSRHIQAAGDLYRYTPADRALHLAAFTFDAAMEQWLTPVCHGAGVVLGDSRDTGEATLAAVRTHGLTVAYPPTSALLQLAEALQARGETLALRIVCVGGEAVSAAALHTIRTVLRPERIINGYGPTETVITPLAWQADDRPLAGYAPIGTALGERSLHILDADLNPVPLGAVGELYIGGPCLARGYHHRPGLSAERFLPDPFTGDGVRLYRTGDRVRCGQDGVIDYLGRTDQQIKLRGYRIEPGEIEAALRDLPGIDDAHVLLRDDDGRRYLAAYLAGGAAPAAALPEREATPPPTDEQLNAALAARLPAYMIPARYVRLAQLPRTAHGKIDRRALPLPEAPERPAPQAPATAAEAVLVKLWQDLLGCQDLGIHDNFFERGGDSILSIQLVSRARAHGLGFTPKDLFQHQTIAGLAPIVQRLNQDAQQQAEHAQGPAAGPAPLLPIQQGFFEQTLPQPAHWNQSLLLNTRAPLDRTALEQALQVLVGHHDGLRLRYVQAQGRWHQHYADLQTAETRLEHHHAADAAAVTALAQQAQRSLNLAHGPLFKAVAIEVADGSQRLLLIAHHLIVDAVSWRILLEDLHHLYTQIRQGQTPRLPAKTASYQAWGRALHAYAQSPRLQSQPAYWQAQTGRPGASWPCDDPHGRAESRDRAVRTLTLTPERTRQLLHEAHRAYRTRLPDLLLAALAQTLSEWTGQTDIAVALEGHGREADTLQTAGQPALDLSRTVGWFTSLYPVTLSPQATAAATLKTIKEQLRQVPDRGLGYGVWRYLGSNIPQPPNEPHPPAATPLDRGASLRSAPPPGGASAGQENATANRTKPQVLFNYLGQLDSSFSEDALWQPAEEDSGDERDPKAPLAYELELNGEIYRGQLRLHGSYSRERYAAQTIDRLLDRYQWHLERLLDHCLKAEPGLTPSDVPLAGLSQAQLDALPVEHRRIEDLYPLSPLQQGILFHALREPEANLYVTQLAVDLIGVDADRFIRAWREVSNRHEILRSGFFWQGEASLQAVWREAEIPVAWLDWRSAAFNEDELTALAQADYARGFDLARPPLQRLTLVGLPRERTRLIWTNHHLLLDGWSSSLFFAEVMAAYEGNTPAPARTSRYRDYIAWLAARDVKTGEAFWREVLREVHEPCLLANCLAAPQQSGNGYVECKLANAETAAVQAFAQQQRLTLNTLMQGAWAMLLSHYTGLRTPVFGTTVAGRPGDLLGAEDMVGLFINTLPVPARIEPGKPVADWLRELQIANLQMREHEYLPLYDIQRWAGTGGGELFDSLLVFENYPVDAALRRSDGGVRIGGLSQRDVTNYPLTLDVTVGQRLEIGFDYARAYFAEDDMRRMAESLRHLLLEIARQPQACVGALGFGETAPVNFPVVSQYPAKELLPSLIGRQAEIRPEAVALTEGGTPMTYGELHRQAYRLAHYLIDHGLRPGEVVALSLPRSAQTIVSCLAVWHCGAAFLALDPAYPAARLQSMLDDAGAAWLLGSDVGNSHPLTGSELTRIELDRLDLSGYPDTPPEVVLHPEMPAYLIYTSGSTGRPKGVAVGHGALAMQGEAMAQLYGLQPGETCLHFASFSFDAAIEQWTVPLLRGATLVIGDPGQWSVDRTLQAIREQAIDRIDVPPAYLTELARQLDPSVPVPRLTSCTVGGEALPRESLALIQNRLQPKRLFNAYGPTEAVITPLAWQAETTCDSRYAPIGQCLGERTAYVLDADLNPLPIGVAGELYIGGLGLAQGYWHQPGLTAERFLPDPFGRGGRLYRTGDRVRQRSDGVIEYLGRIDQQLKLRGFRIEPGEIEAVLLEQPGVNEAAVRVGESGRLLGYVAVDDAGLRLAPNPAYAADGGGRLRDALSRRLPDYLVPAQIIVLPHLPKLPSGKLDRKALPEPERVVRARVEPRNDTERRLAQIWQEVLGLEAVGIEENFFELGGHSLLALRLLSTINRELGWDLPLSRLLQQPTIAALAAQRVTTALSPLAALNNTAGALPPLFCLHPAGGTVFGYYPLARALAGQRPVIGLLCRSFLDANWRDVSLESMARDYADAIAQSQPEGPVHLLGWSLGGALALSIASVLERAGREIAFLGLADCFVPGFEQDETEDGGSDSLRELLRDISPDLADADPEALPEQISAAHPAADWVKLLDLQNGLAIMQHLTELSDSYRIEPIGAGMHCWWSRAAGDAAELAQDILEQACGNRLLRSERIDSDHAGIVRDPDFIGDVIAILQRKADERR
ncbi:non-ribosomal peptide synthetase [Candidatus Methylomicrobium oryzae]|uniref:non-ribosomal peptide synthetase n=1 Tax=Candidatus Methylomicrobium oryzae TaxID=2802053 RepID=UPI0019217CB7|nr:non-ribosomal peptide synthetase [Methylomicrobium sp. RS1]MBL1266032.1 amino acid adenylation domain-containing protein [Methylomicrobium sp. RS1]